MKRILMGALIVMIGAAVLMWWNRTTSRITDSAAWPTTTGRVVHSAIVRDSTRIRGGSYNHLYRADVRYRYAVQGKEYESDTFTFGVPHSFADSSVAAKEAASYPIGTAVKVSYNPSDAKTSCLIPGTVPREFAILLWMTLFFCGIGVVLIFWGILGRRTGA